MSIGPEPPRCEWCGLRYGMHIALGCPDPAVPDPHENEDEEAE